MVAQSNHDLIRRAVAGLRSIPGLSWGRGSDHAVCSDSSARFPHSLKGRSFQEKGQPLTIARKVAGHAIPLQVSRGSDTAPSISHDATRIKQDVRESNRRLAEANRGVVPANGPELRNAENSTAIRRGVRHYSERGNAGEAGDKRFCIPSLAQGFPIQGSAFVFLVLAD